MVWTQLWVLCPGQVSWGWVGTHHAHAEEGGPLSNPQWKPEGLAMGGLCCPGQELAAVEAHHGLAYGHVHLSLAHVEATAGCSAPSPSARRAVNRGLPWVLAGWRVWESPYQLPVRHCSPSHLMSDQKTWGRILKLLALQSWFSALVCQMETWPKHYVYTKSHNHEASSTIITMWWAGNQEAQRGLSIWTPSIKDAGG